MIRRRGRQYNRMLGEVDVLSARDLELSLSETVVIREFAATPCFWTSRDGFNEVVNLRTGT